MTGYFDCHKCSLHRSLRIKGHTVDREIFALDNFRVLNFRAFYFHHLAKWRKFFNGL